MNADDRNPDLEVSTMTKKTKKTHKNNLSSSVVVELPHSELIDRMLGEWQPIELSLPDLGIAIIEQTIEWQPIEISMPDLGIDTEAMIEQTVELLPIEISLPDLSPHIESMLQPIEVHLPDHGPNIKAGCFESKLQGAEGNTRN